MDKSTIESALKLVVDELATIEHERWATWQQYVHHHGKLQADGSLLIPANLVERWSRQIATPYSDLSPDEKQSDIAQVQRYLPTIIDALLNKLK